MRENIVFSPDSMPVLAVIGHKKSGKTTFIEKCVSALSKKGYKLCVIKHIPHEDFTIDTVGKDTWRFSKAGANITVSLAPHEFAIIERSELGPGKLIELLKIIGQIWSPDIVLIEGLKSLVKRHKHIPKVILLRRLDENELLEDMENIAFVIGPETAKVSEMEVLPFSKLDDVIASIENSLKYVRDFRKVLRKLPGINCGDCGFPSCKHHAEAILNGKSTIEKCVFMGERKLVISVDGSSIPLNKFTQDVIRAVIFSLLSTLKGVELSGNELLMIDVKKTK